MSGAGWGSTKLQLYAGEGQVAQEGCVDKKPVNGQLVMFDDHFSFTWIPMKHTVFFSRPSSAVTLEMLRDTLSREDEISNMRSHVSRCFGLDGATEIARRSRGTPRIAGRLLRRVRDYAEVKSDGHISAQVAAQALDLLKVDSHGFDTMDRRLLLTIMEKFDGGPVGVESLAAAISEEAGTLEDVIEPYLIQQGFIMRTPRGRIATRFAYQHFGLKPPSQSQPPTPDLFSHE